MLRKLANYDRTLLRKITYEDQASCGSLPPYCELTLRSELRTTDYRALLWKMTYEVRIGAHVSSTMIVHGNRGGSKLTYSLDSSTRESIYYIHQITTELTLEKVYSATQSQNWRQTSALKWLYVMNLVFGVIINSVFTWFFFDLRPSQKCL